MLRTISVTHDIYQKADILSARERRPLPEVLSELIELGFRVKQSGLDLEWLKMEQEADEDINAGRLSPAYTDAASLQDALDALKG